MELKGFVLLVLFLIEHARSEPGDPVMYLPPFEVRTLGPNNNRMFPFGSSELFPPQQPERVLPQHQPEATMIHTSVAAPAPPPPPPPVMEPTTDRPRDRHNFTFNQFVDVLNEIAEHNEENRDTESRDAGPHNTGSPSDGKSAAARDYGGPPPAYPPYPPYSSYSPYSSYQRPYGPPRPYGPYPGGYGAPRPYGPPPPYHEPAYPTSPVHTSKTVDKPELTGLLKPVTTKVASKVSGLIGLVLTLLTGSAPDDLELKGFKDIVINGIVKPLLIAKGGIKSLISKLSIPVISLLLINLEVLITIWWLWEECPQPTVSSRPSYSYNSYSSY